MSDPFASAKRSLSRGHYHVMHLAERLNAINANERYATLVIQPHSDGANEIAKLVLHPSFRDEFPSIIFDAVSNFRASLDQMLYAIAVPLGLPEDKYLPFTIGQDADWWGKRLDGTKYLPPEIVARLRTFKAYKGGNDTLWALNELCNVKKHAALVPFDLTKTGIALRPMVETVSAHTRSVYIRGPIRMGGHPFDAEANEIVVGFYPKGTHTQVQTQVSYAVVLKHPEKVINGQHPIFLLNAISTEVQAVMNDIEAECRRIGIVQE